MPLSWRGYLNEVLSIYAYIHAFDLHVLSVCIDVYYVKYSKEDILYLYVCILSKYIQIYPNVM